MNRGNPSFCWSFTWLLGMSGSPFGKPHKWPGRPRPPDRPLRAHAVWGPQVGLRPPCGPQTASHLDCRKSLKLIVAAYTMAMRCWESSGMKGAAQAGTPKPAFQLDEAASWPRSNRMQSSGTPSNLQLHKPAPSRFVPAGCMMPQNGKRLWALRRPWRGSSAHNEEHRRSRRIRFPLLCLSGI